MKGYLTPSEVKERKQKFQSAIKTAKTVLTDAQMGLYKNYIGKKVTVMMTTNGSVSGTLVDIAQYEILLENNSEQMIIPKHIIRCVLVGMGSK